MTPSVHRLTPIMVLQRGQQVGCGGDQAGRQSACGCWVILQSFKESIKDFHPKDDNGRLVPRERPVEVARGR